MINEVGMNGVNGIQLGKVKKFAPVPSDTAYVGADSTKAEAPIGPVGYPGASQVKPAFQLKAGEVFNGKAFDVTCLGEGAIPLDLVTADNIAEYSKYPDIWCQKTADEVAGMDKDPRFLHPKVGDSMQFYGVEPFEVPGDMGGMKPNPYINQDPEMIAYARENGLTGLTDDGREGYVNAYNGDRKVIEETYTDANGNFLSEVGGLTGKTQATQVKDTKLVLLAPGSKVTPLESDNPKTVGVGDVVMCAVKKGKAKNDWFVKPATEFLKTAKKNESNAELIDDIQAFVDNGSKREDWMKILAKYGN